MPQREPLTILCIASYKKGEEFLKQCKREGCRVILLTSRSLEGADWPMDSIDEIFYIPDVKKVWNMRDVIYGVSYMARNLNIDKIVALDDYDVEKAASLREHLRIPGMGETSARHFRDKLAMRSRASQAGIQVPEFVHVLNYNKLGAFLHSVPPPYVLKPRLQAGAHGIRVIHSEAEFWEAVALLGDEQSFYLLERFVPGEIFHVDSIIYEKEVVFAIVSKYGLPPMEVAHKGRVFSSRIDLRGTPQEQALQSLNIKVLTSLGLQQGVSHTEFIKAAEDDRFYFLETSARVGGAHISDLVEAATGLNLWREWARIESESSPYTVPAHNADYAGLLISLAKQEWPDLSPYNDPEVMWRLNKKHHAGVIFRSPDYERIEQLMRDYTPRFYDDFYTSLPMGDLPSD
jgi:biotin carboxylase